MVEGIMGFGNISVFVSIFGKSFAFFINLIFKYIRAFFMSYHGLFSEK